MGEDVLNDMLILVLPATVGLLGVLLGFAWARIKAYAKESPAKWDDAVIDLVQKVIAEKKTEWMLEGKKSVERDVAGMIDTSRFSIKDGVFVLDAQPTPPTDPLEAAGLGATR